LPSLQVLASTNPERCYKSADCADSNLDCVIPYTPSVAGQIVRIYARFPSWINIGETNNEKVFVFEGELVDVWESGKMMKLPSSCFLLVLTYSHSQSKSFDTTVQIFTFFFATYTGTATQVTLLSLLEL
jgi:S2P endopeptidase